MPDPSPIATVVARLSSDASTAQKIVDALAESLAAEQFAASAFEEAPGRWSLAIHFRQRPDEAIVRALIASAAGSAAAHALVFETLAPTDWVRKSLEGLAPVEAGRFVVHGAHDRARVRANRIGIEIEAALAFGTGHHGTTRGCLLALDRILRRQNPRRIVDIGSGTGVLAIATARATRRPVVAGDIDPVSVQVARDNARLNRVAALVEMIQANGLSDRRMQAYAPFDLVFANILLGPLRLLAKPIRRLAAPGARIVLSGLLPEDANAALASYRLFGLVLERRIPLDGWTTLVLVRPWKILKSHQVRTPERFDYRAPSANLRSSLRGATAKRRAR